MDSFNQNRRGFFANLRRPFQADRPSRLTVASVRYCVVVEVVFMGFAVIHLAEDVEEDGIQMSVAVGWTTTAVIHFFRLSWSMKVNVPLAGQTLGELLSIWRCYLLCPCIYKANPPRWVDLDLSIHPERKNNHVLCQVTAGTTLGNR